MAKIITTCNVKHKDDVIIPDSEINEIEWFNRHNKNLPENQWVKQHINPQSNKRKLKSQYIFNKTHWSLKELGIFKRYYGKIDEKDLIKYLPPNITCNKMSIVYRGLKKDLINHIPEEIIPELEKLISTKVHKPISSCKRWDNKEFGILKRYYNKVPNKNLCAYLPGRTIKSIQKSHEQNKNLIYSNKINETVIPELDEIIPNLQKGESMPTKHESNDEIPLKLVEKINHITFTKINIYKAIKNYNKNLPENKKIIINKLFEQLPENIPSTNSNYGDAWNFNELKIITDGKLLGVSNKDLEEILPGRTATSIGTKWTQIQKENNYKFS